MTSKIDFPAINGRVVTESHARICQEIGHATHTIDGVDQEMCPRCGQNTKREIKCGNKKVHGRVFAAYHPSKEAVRDCFAQTYYEESCEGAAEAYADDEDGSGAYARYLERRAESGSWFGFGE